MSLRAFAVAVVTLGSSAAAYAQPTMVTAAKGPATLRNCPKPKCAVVGTLPEGAEAVVMREERGWYWLDVPKSQRSETEFFNSAWVLAKDVQPVANTVVSPSMPPIVSKVIPTQTDDAPESPEPLNCLACAATKEITGDVTLTAEGEAVGGPGAGEPMFEENMAMAREKLGRQLAAAADLADSARADLNRYMDACYGKYTRHDVHAGAAAGVQTNSAAVGVARTWNGSWAAVATASSSYAWRESWVDGVDVSNETTAYCRGLWSDVSEQAAGVQRAAADIKAQASGLGVWPLVIFRLLGQYGLK